MLSFLSQAGRTPVGRFIPVSAPAISIEYMLNLIKVGSAGFELLHYLFGFSMYDKWNENIQVAISLVSRPGSGGSLRYATLSHTGVIMVVRATMIITVV